MPVDVYYAPTESAKKIPVEVLARMVKDAGFPCSVEHEDDGIDRVVLDPLNSSLVVSFDESGVTFVTFEAATLDECAIELSEAVERIMTEIGFSESEAY